jgi:hypothetical protein
MHQMLWETTPYQLLNDKMTVYSMTQKKKKKKNTQNPSCQRVQNECEEYHYSFVLEDLKIQKNIQIFIPFGFASFFDKIDGYI